MSETVGNGNRELGILTTTINFMRGEQQELKVTIEHHTTALAAQSLALALLQQAQQGHSLFFSRSWLITYAIITTLLSGFVGWLFSNS